MTTITILPENPGFALSYRAISGNKQSSGKTAGEALDAITSQMTEADAVTLVVLQNQQPDRFFTAQQRNRLAELMSGWRQARDSGRVFSPEEQTELDALVEAETRAATARAESAIGRVMAGASLPTLVR